MVANDDNKTRGYYNYFKKYKPKKINSKSSTFCWRWQTGKEDQNDVKPARYKYCYI